MKTFVTIQQAVKQTGISQNTISGWTYSGKVRSKNVKMTVGEKTYLNRVLVCLEEVLAASARSRKCLASSLSVDAILECIQKTEPKKWRTDHDSIWNQARRELAALQGMPVGEKAIWDRKTKGWVYEC